MKAYLVSEGHYSDYIVEAIFSNKEKAEDYIKGFTAGYNDIREFEIDPEFVPVKNNMWKVHMRKDGIVEWCGLVDTRSNMFEDGYSVYGNKAIFTVGAKNKKHAIKIANEKRAYLIANDAWVETV